MTTRAEQLEFDLNREKEKSARLQKVIDDATLLLERATKPMDRPELVREALEKLRRQVR